MGEETPLVFIRNFSPLHLSLVSWCWVCFFKHRSSLWASICRGKRKKEKMNSALKAALINSNSNNLHFSLRAALFHSTPVLERKRRNFWDSVSFPFSQFHNTHFPSLYDTLWLIKFFWSHLLVINTTEISLF